MPLGTIVEAMRLLLCILAFIGLLLSPAAATAAAASCVHEQGAMTMEAMAASQHAAAAEHDCCPEMGKSSSKKDRPQQHDSKACAQACAAMCAVSAAMPGPEPDAFVAGLKSTLRPAPSPGLHPFAPPGLKRPPRTFA